MEVLLDPRSLLALLRFSLCVKLVLLLTVAVVVVFVGFKQFFSSTVKISVDPLRRSVFFLSVSTFSFLPLL